MKTDITENTQPSTTHMPTKTTGENADAENNGETLSNGWTCNGTICIDNSNVEGSGTEPKADSSLSDEAITTLEETTGWACNGTICIDLGPKYNLETSNQGNCIDLYRLLPIIFKGNLTSHSEYKLYLYILCIHTFMNYESS